VQRREGDEAVRKKSSSLERRLQESRLYGDRLAK
jgi:hypothetical protein